MAEHQHITNKDAYHTSRGRMRVCSCGWCTLVTAWNSFQVELRGQYSLVRHWAFHSHSQHASLARVFLTMALTPILCLLAVLITDSISLQSPERGIGHTHIYWARGVFTSFIYSYAAIDQIQCYVPQLSMSQRERLAVALLSAVFVNAVAYALSRSIDFPLSFALTISSAPWSISFSASLWLLRGRFLRQHLEVLRDRLGYLLVCLCQLSMVVLYPTFFAVFTNLSSSAQTTVVLLLPVIKLIEKNLIGRTLRDRGDAKPEMVIFNSEIFNALFVSCCMRSATPVNTSLTLMGIDFLQASLSLRSLSKRLADAKKMRQKLGAAGRRHAHRGDNAHPPRPPAAHPASNWAADKLRYAERCTGNIEQQCPNARQEPAARREPDNPESTKVQPSSTGCQSFRKPRPP